ncbi:hypothetical protein [Asaia sp. VD9]|uniref:hypothetical protein n=1 Tax=Asaia sp. VD9 TaxID=3081235 RepID=UPI0030192E2D
MNLADREHDREEAKKRWRSAMGIRQPSRLKKTLIPAIVVVIIGSILTSIGPSHLLEALLGYLASFT